MVMTGPNIKNRRGEASAGRRHLDDIRRLRGRRRSDGVAPDDTSVTTAEDTGGETIVGQVRLIQAYRLIRVTSSRKEALGWIAILTAVSRCRRHARPLICTVIDLVIPVVLLLLRLMLH